MMKKISIFLFAAAALLGAGCDDSSDTDKVIPVSAIALDTSLSGGISLVVGQTADIAGKVTVRPENATDKTETYESSDPETVSVDDAGVVKAVKPGLAMVTISVGGKHSHFEVEVREQRISVESVTLPTELADGVTLMPPAEGCAEMPLIACLTEKGRLVIFAHDEIRRLSNGGMGVSLVKLESGERMIGMTLVDERGLTASGTGRGGKPREVQITRKSFEIGNLRGRDAKLFTQMVRRVIFYFRNAFNSQSNRRLIRHKLRQISIAGHDRCFITVFFGFL